MSFDLKYRPLLFKDVVGQQGTVSILQALLKNGQVFQKSYIFAGPSGTGKTTTARILARAMLCPDITPEGEPCNTCTSCREIIEGTSSFSYVEMDAANNSGVDTIRAIVESIEYHTLGGRSRKIYLLDEAHRLSSASIDALLKPMEDNVPGTKDKRLVCLFCTTEPEKLKDTLKARCMTFGVRSPEKEDVVERLAYICGVEGITYEPEALEMIYAYGRGHVRDMVSALERVSHVGDITHDNVKEQLGLGAVTAYYEILNNLRDNLPKAMEYVEEALSIVDPPVVYEGIAEAALAAHRVVMGINIGLGGFIDNNIAKAIYGKYNDAVLGVADRILSRGRDITLNTLLSEVIMLHRYLNGVGLPPVGSGNPNESYEPVKKESPAAEPAGADAGDGEETPQHVEAFIERAKGDADMLYPGASSFVRPDVLKTKKGEGDVNTRKTSRGEVRPLTAEEMRAAWDELAKI